MKNKSNKQKKNINSGDTKEKKLNPNLILKEKTDKEKSIKDIQIINVNINNKIQNMRNNAAEKLKLISKNNEYPLKQINTESLFKNKKVNNIQPISSKSNNSNPFRNSSKGIRDIKSKKNISSKKKIVVANLNSNSNNSFVVKDRDYSKNKNKDILSHANNPGTEKSKRINNIY